MRPRAPHVTIYRNYASSLLGVFFCGGVLCFGSACSKRSHTPDWDTQATRSLHTAPTATRLTATAPPTTTKLTAAGGLRFITYNVENWLTMDRYLGGKKMTGLTKPASQKQAVIQLLARHAPDVLGLCEIGTPCDLAEIQQNLKTAGLELTYRHYTGGSDPTRHLGLLSRYPITSTAKPTTTEYRISGQTFAINRGILDATITAQGKTYRMIGVHLKSKRDSEQGDQETIRFNEARLLRLHLDTIFKEDANARLIVYGDFNDSPASPALKTLTAHSSSPSDLTIIPENDSHHETWTYHWALHEIYSRIDLILVSRALRHEVDFPAAKIIDDSEWQAASDHRPVMAIFK